MSQQPRSRSKSQKGYKVSTSNTYLDAISCIDSVLKECLASEDNDLKKMAMKMKLKFDKYWGDIKKFNLLQEKNLAEVKRGKTESSVTKNSKSELDRYLIEEIEGDEAYFTSGDFTVLVASESTFRTEGRVLDSFRSSLSPETVQALICCQDWVRSVDVAVNLKENIDDLKKFEDDNLLFPFSF
nr:hypothetical protein [Tanacetum cinerariifolium]